jgi:RNA polymerase-binding transcription factor DksA
MAIEEEDLQEKVQAGTSEYCIDCGEAIDLKGQQLTFTAKEEVENDNCKS